MKKSQKEIRLQSALFAVSALVLSYALPALVNTHDSLALICGIIIAMSWAIWAFIIASKIMKEIKNEH